MYLNYRLLIETHLTVVSTENPNGGSNRDSFCSETFRDRLALLCSVDYQLDDEKFLLLQARIFSLSSDPSEWSAKNPSYF